MSMPPFEFEVDMCEEWLLESAVAKLQAARPNGTSIRCVRGTSNYKFVWATCPGKHWVGKGKNRKKKPNHGHVMIVGSDGNIYDASLDSHSPQLSSRDPNAVITDHTYGNEAGWDVSIWRRRRRGGTPRTYNIPLNLR